MKNHKAILRTFWLVFIAGVLSVSVLIYWFPYELWKQKSSHSKWLAAHIITLPGHLRGATKNEVFAELGQPDRKSDRYALLLLRDNSWKTGMNADLLIRLDATNGVTEICYAWSEFRPTSSNRFDPQAWQTSSPEMRIAMSADLLRRWQDRGLAEQFRTLPETEKTLGDTLFVDQWRYMISDWTALVVDFDVDGNATNVEIGSDD